MRILVDEGPARGWADVLGVVSIFTCGLRRELGHSAAAGASSTGASETWTLDILVDAVVDEDCVVASDKLRLSRTAITPQTKAGFTGCSSPV